MNIKFFLEVPNFLTKFLFHFPLTIRAIIVHNISTRGREETKSAYFRIFFSFFLFPRASVIDLPRSRFWRPRAHFNSWRLTSSGRGLSIFEHATTTQRQWADCWWIAATLNRYRSLQIVLPLQNIYENSVRAFKYKLWWKTSRKNECYANELLVLWDIWLFCIFRRVKETILS